MRVVVATLIILIIFITGTFVLNNYIDESCNELLKDVEVLISLIEENKWTEAKVDLLELQDKWTEIKKRWQLFLGHYEMDSIDIAISRLEQYVKIEDKSSSLGELAEFNFLVSHIKDKEKLKLQNIL